MNRASAALNALADGRALLRRRASTCRRVGSGVQRSQALVHANTGFIRFHRRTGRLTAHSIALRTHPLMNAASVYDSSRAIFSDEQRRGKRKAALQLLRAAVAHRGDTIGSQQGEMDVELMYDGVHYLEHVISPRLDNELQPISGMVTDLEVVHGILHVWCRERRNSVDSPIASIEPRIMLDWIDQLASTIADARSAGSLVISPTRETYRYLMDADPTNAELVETLFDRMLDTADPGLSPTVDDFHRIMHANIQNRRVQTAESYLQALLQLHRSNHQARSTSGVYQPSPRTYNLIIAGYAKAERPHDANRILQQMLDDGFVADPSSEVPAYCFETCLNAWVASRHKSAGHRAETLILQMQRMGMRPSERSLAKVIAAWTQSKRSNAPQRAEAILRLLLSMAEEDDDPATSGRTNRSKVVLDAYLHVVRAFALTGARDPAAPDQCQRLMKELLSSKHVAPSTPGRIPSSTGNSLRKLCALVCLAWARSKRRDSVQHIEQLFHQLEAGFGLPLDRFCRNTLLEGHASAGDGSGALRTWSRFFERTGYDSSLAPDVQSVNSVLLALHRSNEASSALTAEDFWNRVRNMPSVKPNVVTINVLLSLAGKSDKVETARRGEAYLAELENLYREGDSACRPNLVTYTKAIELWVNINRRHQAEALRCVQAHWVSMQRQRMRPSDATRKAYLDIQQRMK
jgi:pentatricopeptide repeat protein